MKSLLLILFLRADPAVPDKFRLPDDYVVTPTDPDPAAAAPSWTTAPSLRARPPFGVIPQEGTSADFPGINSFIPNMSPDANPGAWGLDHPEASAIGLVTGALIVGTLNPSTSPSAAPADAPTEARPATPTAAPPNP